MIGISAALAVASDDRAANFTAYADPSLPIAPAVVDAVAAFVTAKRGGALSTAVGVTFFGSAGVASGTKLCDDATPWLRRRGSGTHMIKLIFCLRRLPTLSLDDFHAYWIGTHAPLVASIRDDLAVRRYTQSHLATDPRLSGNGEVRGVQVPPYDGVAELWWDSIEALMQVASSPAGRAAGRMLIEDERKFIDLPNSPIFYTEEHEIFGA